MHASHVLLAFLALATGTTASATDKCTLVNFKKLAALYSQSSLSTTATTVAKIPSNETGAAVRGAMGLLLGTVNNTFTNFNYYKRHLVSGSGFIDPHLQAGSYVDFTNHITPEGILGLVNHNETIQSAEYNVTITGCAVTVDGKLSKEFFSQCTDQATSNTYVAFKAPSCTPVLLVVRNEQD